MNALSPSQPTTNGTPAFHPETDNHIEPQLKRSIGDKKRMYENRTDDEKSGSLQLEPKVDPYSIPPATIEKDKLLFSSMNGSRGAVDEAVQVSTAPTVQSSAALSKMDALLLNLEEDGGSFGNHTRYSYGHFFKPSVFIIGYPLHRHHHHHHLCLALFFKREWCCGNS